MRALSVRAAAAALSAVAQAAQADDLPTIRLGWVVAPGSTATLLMIKPDASEHQDKT